MKPRPLKANPSARGFGKFFERTCVITLTRRPERRARLERHLRRLGLHHGIQWVDAADGHIQKPPRDWRAGAGAWGCRLSHLHVLQQAQADRVEHLLILEDDVVFSPHTADCLPLLLRDLPAVWGQFYLGGQHLADPAETITPRLWRAVNINRTHAYAVHRPALSAIRAHLARLRDYKGRQWHVDHQLGRGQESRLWETYAPSWWLAGQAEGRSDIAGDEPEERWWHHPRYALHLPLFTVPDGVRLPAAQKRTLLFDAMDERRQAAMQDRLAFFQWCRGIAEAALTAGRLPAWRGALPKSLVSAWPARVRRWSGTADAAAYPFNGLFPHPLALPFS